MKKAITSNNYKNYTKVESKSMYMKLKRFKNKSDNLKKSKNTLLRNSVNNYSRTDFIQKALLSSLTLSHKKKSFYKNLNSTISKIL